MTATENQTEGMTNLKSKISDHMRKNCETAASVDHTPKHELHALISNYLIVCSLETSLMNLAHLRDALVKPTN